MDIERLKALIKKYRENRAYYIESQNAYNETECRDEYISPLLECFGWDVQNAQGKLPQYKDVVVERYANKSERPDYTLTLNGVSKIFVEAKKPSVDITIELEPAMQTRRYGWNANHAMAILTNFENLLIYDTTNKPEKGDRTEVSLYRKYHFEEYVEKYAEIYRFISKDSVYTGKYDDFISRNFKDSSKYKTEIDEAFLKQINDWRLELGKDLYSKDQKYQNLLVLNDTVQEFINQIVFVRICEDRQLPLYKRLFELAEDKDKLQQSLIKVFKEADKRYNSGLFKGKNPIFDLNNDNIFNIIKSLYYPQTPYMFTIIEPSILGKIYESFLAEHLDLKDGFVCLAKKEEYRYKSVISTPVEIVKYMVKKTIAPLCEGKDLCDILKLKIADIACGSGIFLVETYQYLVDYVSGWYQSNKPDALLELNNGRKKLPLEVKRDILVSCIYGIDIDQHAVEVSKFSLLLKLIEDETTPSVSGYKPILPDLSNNIKNGNSLVSVKDISDSHLDVNELLSIVPFEWDEFEEGITFDAILGNPPYVKTEDMHSLSSEIEFNIYKKKFASAHKQFDKYYLFMEQALHLLKQDGLLCYIVPNKFFKIASGQELRKILSDKVTSIEDFGDAQLFEDKTIYSSIVSAQNMKSKKLTYSVVNNVTRLWSGDNIESIDIDSSKLGKTPWLLTDDMEFLKMLRALEDKTVLLSEIVSIYNGIQTSAERAEKFSDKKEVYWFSEDAVIEENGSVVRIQKYGRKYQIEKDILKPYFKPTKAAEKGMETYSLLKTDKRIIFPYNAEGKLLDIDTMKNTYPGTWEYLNDCYDRLVPKTLNNGVGRDVPDATSKNWYQYGRTQALTAFINTPKLIVRVLSKIPMYAYDARDMLIASGGTAGYCAISELANSEYALEYIQAWLIHPFTEKILQIKGSDFENGFTARGTFSLKTLPFVEIDFGNNRQKRIYDEVVSKTREVYALNGELFNRKDKASQNVINMRKNMLIQEIQGLITKIYQQDFR